MKHYHQMIQASLSCEKSQFQIKKTLPIVTFLDLTQETLCNMKCKLRALPKSRSETIRDDIRTFFEERKPYDFLQLCYYQVGKHQAAASAAFTNLAANPEVGGMRRDFRRGF